jgi:hypothetical protein
MITLEDGTKMETCECYVKLDNMGNCPAIEYNCFDCPDLVKSYEKGDENDGGESRSSCTGTSCEVSDMGANGGKKDHEIQLDSLEDLAHVIQEEVVNNKPKGRTLAPKDREYERFIDDNGMVVTDEGDE